MGWSSKYPNQGTTGNHKNPMESCPGQRGKTAPTTRAKAVGGQARPATLYGCDVTSFGAQQKIRHPKNTSVGWMHVFFVEFCVKVMDDDIEYRVCMCLFLLHFLIRAMEYLMGMFFFFVCLWGWSEIQKDIWATCFFGIFNRYFNHAPQKQDIKNWWRKDLGLSSLK